MEAAAFLLTVDNGGRRPVDAANRHSRRDNELRRQTVDTVCHQDDAAVPGPFECLTDAGGRVSPRPVRYNRIRTGRIHVEHGRYRPVILRYTVREDSLARADLRIHGVGQPKRQRLVWFVFIVIDDAKQDAPVQLAGRERHDAGGEHVVRPGLGITANHGYSDLDDARREHTQRNPDRRVGDVFRGAPAVVWKAHTHHPGRRRCIDERRQSGGIGRKAPERIAWVGLARLRKPVAHGEHVLMPRCPDVPAHVPDVLVVVDGDGVGDVKQAIVIPVVVVTVPQPDLVGCNQAVGHVNLGFTVPALNALSTVYGNAAADGYVLVPRQRQSLVETRLNPAVRECGLAGGTATGVDAVVLGPPEQAVPNSQLPPREVEGIIVVIEERFVVVRKIDKRAVADGHQPAVELAAGDAALHEAALEVDPRTLSVERLATAVDDEDVRRNGVRVRVEMEQGLLIPVRPEAVLVHPVDHGAVPREDRPRHPGHDRRGVEHETTPGLGRVGGRERHRLPERPVDRQGAVDTDIVPVPETHGCAAFDGQRGPGCNVDVPRELDAGVTCPGRVVGDVAVHDMPCRGGIEHDCPVGIDGLEFSATVDDGPRRLPG